jgi:DNA helicase HerA-like ATPase
MVVGICVGETSLTEVTFISDKMPKVGEYVTIEYDGKQVLGMIENLIRGNDALNVDINDFKAIQKISKIGVDENYIRGKVKILGDVNDNLKLPRTPVLPGTEIRLADKDILKEIFKVRNPLKLGTLVNQSDVKDNIRLAEFQYSKGNRKFDFTADLKTQLNTTGVSFSFLNVIRKT